MTKSLKAAAAGLALLATTATAEDVFPVYKLDAVRAKGSAHVDLPAVSDFTFLAGSGHTSYDMCLLMPHTQDPVFIAYMYGAISQAERLGQSLTIFDAGGYGHDVNQRAQFENCLTSGANAILIQPVNPSGWEADIADAQEKGVVVVNVSEALDAMVDGRSVVDFRVNGKLLGDTILGDLEDASAEAKVLVIPGPAGLPFVEDTIVGLREAFESTEVEILDVMYGDMDPAAQLKLVEDALVTYPDVNYIVGSGLTVGQAQNVLAQRGKTEDIKLLATYLDKGLQTAIAKGRVLAGAAESSVMLTAIGVNLAVAELEGSGAPTDLIPSVTVVTKANAMDEMVEKANFAPQGWKPVFKTN